MSTMKQGIEGLNGILDIDTENGYEIAIKIPAEHHKYTSVTLSVSKREVL